MRDRAKRKKYKREYRPTFRLSRSSMIIALVGFALVFGLFYLSQANSMAASGYDIAKLERQQDQLMAENQKLQVESSRLQSIQNVDDGIKKSGMVPVGQINYVPASSNVATALK